VENLAGHAFISYVREDSSKVDELQQILEAAGVPVWRDTADLWPGDPWRIKIREAITYDALVFIACFSSRSVARQRSYQNEELALAIEELRLRQPDDPWLIPVRFDDCAIPDRELGAGRTLGSIQQADLFGPGRGLAAERLVTVVKRLLGHQAAVTGPPSGLVLSGSSDPRHMGSGSTAVGQDRDSAPALASQSRCARLLAEAVRAAHAVTSKERAATLTEVAAVVAANDPNRAARLLADAERVARTITGISEKAAALAEMAELLAATDPLRARRLATEAERAQTTADLQLKVQNLKVPTGEARDGMRTSQVSSDRSMQAFNNMRARPATLARVAEALAATEPDHAERVAQAITEPDRQARTLARVAQVVAAADPDRGARLTADAEHAARAITDESLKAVALDNVAAVVAATDPDRTARLAAEAQRIAQTISHSGLTGQGLARVACVVAATDPDHAERIAQTITEDYSKASALACVAEATAATDPDRAERVAQAITENGLKVITLARVAGVIAATDPDRAVRLAGDAEGIAQALSYSGLAGMGLARVAHVVAATDPDHAEHIAQTITDPRWKAKALTRVAEVLAGRADDPGE
jgi:hypothetical protein